MRGTANAANTSGCGGLPLLKGGKLTNEEGFRQRRAPGFQGVRASPIRIVGHPRATLQYEVLLRMRDGHGDLIPPGTFLYIAERLGLVQEIDRWVVSHAIDLLAEHRADGRDLRFEVNLSGNSIGDPLPFDYLKIDGEYVRHCASNETDRILISAVVQIARGMGKRTIAEFVGDQETVEVLTRLGVDYGQGYFLGRPQPLADHLARQAEAYPQQRPDAPPIGTSPLQHPSLHRGSMSI